MSDPAQKRCRMFICNRNTIKKLRNSNKHLGNKAKTLRKQKTQLGKQKKHLRNVLKNWKNKYGKLKKAQHKKANSLPSFLVLQKVHLVLFDSLIDEDPPSEETVD